MHRGDYCIRSVGDGQRNAVKRSRCGRHESVRLVHMVRGSAYYALLAIVYSATEVSLTSLLAHPLVCESAVYRHRFQRSIDG